MSSVRTYKATVPASIEALPMWCLQKSSLRSDLGDCE